MSIGLTIATVANKNIVNTTYLPNVVAMDTNQSLLVTMAFDAIINGQINNTTANCQIAVIIVTDRHITDDIANVVANNNRNIQSLFQINPAKMFVISLTDNPSGYYDNIAVRLTCNHSGIWNKVLFVCPCVCHCYNVLFLPTQLHTRPFIASVVTIMYPMDHVILLVDHVIPLLRLDTIYVTVVYCCSHVSCTYMEKFINRYKYICSLITQLQVTYIN